MPKREDPVKEERRQKRTSNLLYVLGAFMLVLAVITWFTNYSAFVWSATASIVFFSAGYLARPPRPRLAPRAASVRYDSEVRVVDPKSGAPLPGKYRHEDRGEERRP